jgi:transposase-like protein
MSSRGPYRGHASEFKIQLCRDIRSGAIGRREAAQKHALSTNLIQLWLSQYELGDLSTEEAEASVISEYEPRLPPWSARLASSPWSWIWLKNSAPAPHERQRELLHRHRPEACSIRRGCQVIDLPRSTFYYRSTAANEHFRC